MAPLLKLDTNGTPLWRVLLLIIIAAFSIGFILRDSVGDVLTGDLQEDIVRIDAESKARDQDRVNAGAEFRAALKEQAKAVADLREDTTEAINGLKIQMERQTVVLEMLERRLRD